MPLLWIVVTIILSPTLVIILKHLLQNYGKQAPRLPPGPRRWPILRSIISPFKPHPSNTLGDFMETQISEYGKIFTMEFAGEINIISADAEFNRFVLTNEMRLFENNHPQKMSALKSKEALGYLKGNAYRMKKSVVLAFINSFGPQSSFIDCTDQIAAGLMSAWRDKGVVHMYEETNRFAFNTILKLATGVSMNHPEIERLNKDGVTFYSGAAAVPINFPGTRYYQCLKARERLSKFALSILKERKVDEKNRIGKTDLIEHLMSNTSYTQDEIIDTVVWILFGGHYTVATTLAAAIHFLSSCPKAIEQLREEVRESIKSQRNGKFACDDYKKMEFTQSVINESLRISNVAPLLFKRALQDIEFKDDSLRISNVTPLLFKRALQDIEFKEFVIPKGTPVMTDTAAAHLDPSVFENPSEFDPWRWLGEDKKNMLNSFMPFGGGLRYCPGRDMTRIEIAVFLHRLVLNYNWEPVEPDEPIASPMVTLPKGLPMRILARNSS